VFLQSVRQSPSPVPIPICVSMKLGHDTGMTKPDDSPALFAVTEGLSAFGIMEIEVGGYGGHLQSLYETVLNRSYYLITSVSVIKDGVTFGPDADTKIVVRWQASALVPDRMVHRVHL